MLSLDHQSPIPLRAQVEALLRDLIRQPHYQNGGLLPDEVALAAELGVSRGTIRSGISKLVFEGLWTAKRAWARAFQTGTSNPASGNGTALRGKWRPKA